MKISKTFVSILALAFMLTACGTTDGADDGTVKIDLSDNRIKVNGKTATDEINDGVFVANDIVYYEVGKDFTYGEGSAADAHTAQDAMTHSVVHITQAGTYNISGKLSQGQIAVDLGSEAKTDPNAVVTLILNGIDVTCEVAPAIIFYNVYECGNDNAEIAIKDVDTSNAGARVIIADGTVNTVNGSYVARIYQPGSVVLDSDGTEVEDAKKLHKYDAAFYSKMSMNVSGGEKGDGILNINAENEGLDSELHLTINGGNINIQSGNDGINTNEDEVSVTTINNGVLKIKVTGETGEGDGIDSNGWLVINGGSVTAEACSFSGDAGIDSDMGIYINGGTVSASGSMLDRIEAGGQNYAVFNFAQRQKAGETVTLKNESQQTLAEWTPQNDYSIWIYSSPQLIEGTYTLWSGDVQLQGSIGNQTGRPGFSSGMMPSQDRPKDGEFPKEKFDFEKMEPPQDRVPSTNDRPPRDFDDYELPQLHNGSKVGETSAEITSEFNIVAGRNMFAVVK